MMKYTKIISSLSIVTLAGTIFLSSPVVYAETDATLADIQTAKVSLKEAGDIALKEAGAGKIATIDLNNEEGQLQYEVTILSRTTEKEYTIDAESGEILESSREKLSVTDREERTIAKSNLKVDLDDLEKILAETYADAKIVELDLEIKRGDLVYDVTLVNSEEVIDVRVDAVSGAIRKESVTGLEVDDDDDLDED